MIKSVLFDFDDTLVKTKLIRYKALKEVGKKFYKLNIQDKDIDKHWGKPFDSFISGVFKNSDDVQNLIKNFKSILHKYPNKPYPNTNVVLKKLAKKYLLGIVSSSNPDFILSGMNDVGIKQKFFFFIQSSEDTNVHKPNPNVFLPSIKRLNSKNIDKSEIIYCGDSLNDYLAAKNAGLHFCGIANRTFDENEFKNRKIPYITKFNNLPSYIESKNRRS